MSFETQLLHGVAARLATVDLGVWRPTGPAYTAGETGIVLSRMPPTPDRVIVLTDYPVDPSGAPAGDTVHGIQIRTRAGTNPDDVRDLAGDIRDALDGLSHVWLGTVRVSQIVYRSGEYLPADAGADGNDRCQRTDNYYVYAARELPHYTP